MTVDDDKDEFRNRVQRALADPIHNFTCRIVDRTEGRYPNVPLEFIVNDLIADRINIAIEAVEALAKIYEMSRKEQEDLAAKIATVILDNAGQ
jgi:hypothetical protein